MVRDPVADLEPGAEGATTAPADRPTAEDAAIFARIADGDRDAFAELYRRYFHELYDFAARITRDRDAAADIVQTVFAGVWERVRKGEHVRSPRAWLYRVTHNAAIDEIRRRGRTLPDGDDGFSFAAMEDVQSPAPERAVIDKELADLVWSTAAVLSPDDYALLDLHFRRDLSAAELADELGISTGAVYTRLSRLRRSFEDALTVTLLARRGGDECKTFAELVSELGERANTPEGNGLLQAHVRDCATCQASRRRFVTAAEVLAGIAPVPLIPGVADAVWSNLSGAFDLSGAAGDSGKPASEGRAHPGPASGSPIGSGALAHPVAAAALTLVVAALVAVGVWAIGTAPPEAPSTGLARDPSLVWSPTHSPGRPSSESVISIRWSLQPDALAYSVLWSPAPTQVPDSVPDLPGSATGTTSPTLAPGRWYFHLRTQGRDRSWTHTVHRGPFVVIARAESRPDSAAGSGTTDGSSPTPAGPGSAAPRTSSPGPGATPSPTAPTRDSTPPSGHTVELAGGPYYRSLAVPLVLRDGVDRGSGVDRATGIVERLTGVLARGRCERWSDTWHTVALDGSTDSTVADGRCYRYRYRIADRAGNRSAVSKPSGVAMVDTTPPSPPVLSLSESGVHTFAAGTTMFIRPGAAGTFAVEAASADDSSGVAAIEFPALTREAVPTRRTAAPYEAVYTWSSATITTGAKKVVTAWDRAGNAASASFMVTADADPPTGMSATLAGGPWFAAALALHVEYGSDAGSGVNRGSATVERQSASLQAGACGSFTGAWEPVSLAAGADARVQAGRCYRYRVSVSDNVGNRSSSAASGEASIDTTAPSPPQLTMTASALSVHVSRETVFYRPGAQGALTVAATTADAESGIDQVLFPPLAGAGGGIDDTAPYAAAYTWAQPPTPGPYTVTARNRAGLVSDGIFTMTADGDPPTGMSLTLVGGPDYPGAAVPYRIDEGSDAASGVDRRSVTVERDSAPMTPVGCGPFSGVWTPLDFPGTADTTVVAGNCYRYRVSVSDNVGNRGASPPSADARVR